MTALLRPVLLLIALPLIAGCSALSALDDAAQPLDIYELRPLSPQAESTRSRDVELVVEEPATSGTLATERIMIRPTPLQAQYLPGIRWADTAPVMLQTLIVRTLSGTGALRSVARRPVGASADYALLGELTDFHAEPRADGAGATVRVRLLVRIVRERDASVVASRTFAASEPAETTDPDAVIAAFDRASAALLADMTPWVLARTVVPSS
jgi:cholesterol transport system auxiliary component